MTSQNSRPIFLLAIFCLPFFYLFAMAQDGGEASKLKLSTEEEIRSEFDSVPCKNGDRQKAVKSLFERMGAKPEEIRVEKNKGVENVVVRKAAAEETTEKIVVGAHYDKVADGCGAIDNWTGIVAVAHMYRAVKDLPLKKNIIFVAFGKEEEGLLGSAAMVSGIKKEEAPEYCAMINIDSLGIAIPQTLDNVSSKKLIDLSADLAKEMIVPFSHVTIEGASSDSASFISKKIPAVTIHALSDDWRKILHSSNDKPAKINSESVYLGYRLTLGLLARVDTIDCQSFRDQKGKDQKATDR